MNVDKRLLLWESFDFTRLTFKHIYCTLQLCRRCLISIYKRIILDQVYVLFKLIFKQALTSLFCK